MSAASAWARLAPKEIHLPMMGGRYSSVVFLVKEGNEPGMRIDNAGPFNKRQSLRLARWILDVFGDEPAKDAAP